MEKIAHVWQFLTLYVVVMEGLMKTIAELSALELKDIQKGLVNNL